jgi:hypothetical protein
MPRYRVLIHGQNFRLKLDSQWEKYAFYTPRYADAPDPVLAEQLALEDFRASPKYRELMGQALNSESDPPVLSGEDIEETDAHEDFKEGPPGLALYSEEDETDSEQG